MNQEIGNPNLTPEMAEAARAYLKLMAGGFKTCPTCSQPVEHKEQVLCCVYARPCGHRLYHGTLSKGEKQG